MDEQAKEPRESKCHPAMGWIGSFDLTGNGADFKGGRNREISRENPLWHEMLANAMSIKQIGQP